MDVSNLQRQVLHTNASVGKPKTASAAAAIRALNPDVTVVEHNLRLDASNVLGVIEPYDVIVDGCDNFATKYLVNDATELTGKTVVYGSIFRFEGQASVFKPGSGPCYRCLFPEPTPSALAPSCGLLERLLEPNGEVRWFVRIFVNEEDIRFRQDRDTKLVAGDTVAIIPAIAGG